MGPSPKAQTSFWVHLFVCSIGRHHQSRHHYMHKRITFDNRFEIASDVCMANANLSKMMLFLHGGGNLQGGLGLDMGHSRQQGVAARPGFLFFFFFLVWTLPTPVIIQVYSRTLTQRAFQHLASPWEFSAFVQQFCTFGSLAWHSTFSLHL